MASRRIEDCVPELQTMYAAFEAAMRACGLPFIVTCTARTVREQIALYAQGRAPLEEVNRLRLYAGLPPIGIDGNRKVTWTLQSKHLVDLDDGHTGNDKSRAFDIAILKDGRPVWDVKVDVNADHIPDYDQAGAIGESVGLRWGGRFKTPDRPHFEV